MRPQIDSPYLRYIALTVCVDIWRVVGFRSRTVFPSDLFERHGQIHQLEYLALHNDCVHRPATARGKETHFSGDVHAKASTRLSLTTLFCASLLIQQAGTGCFYYSMAFLNLSIAHTSHTRPCEHFLQ